MCLLWRNTMHSALNSYDLSSCYILPMLCMPCASLSTCMSALALQIAFGSVLCLPSKFPGRFLYLYLFRLIGAVALKLRSFIYLFIILANCFLSRLAHLLCLNYAILHLHETAYTQASSPIVLKLCCRRWSNAWTFLAHLILNLC